ncbi:sulfite exporter TauE/SafE family protein, partial [Nguyenibacter vanlangensis]|nr:sulfite exporter TauE/SafE family protein [Nguyenibacter vanlangensis]
MLLWSLIFAVSTLAFGLSAVSGGGAGLILMPLLGLAV